MRPLDHGWGTQFFIASAGVLGHSRPERKDIAVRFLLVLIGVFVLTACADRYNTPVVPDAAGVGETRGIYVATNRKINDSGRLKGDRGEELLFEEVLVSIPPTHMTGDLMVDFSNPAPDRSFVVANRRPITGMQEFQTNLTRDLARLRKEDRQLTLYIHGYNTSYPESLFRAAQLSHDLIIPGITVAFSWPSRAKVLRYNYDRDSVLYSRNDLAELLRVIAQTGATEINLIGHSIGSQLLMEALQLIELQDPGFTKKHLGGVFLISPDIDLGVFKSQIANFEDLPQPFGVIVSRRDGALRLSEILNGPSRRLGRHLNPEGLDHYPIAIFDISAFANGQAANHFTFGDNSTLIGIFQRRDALDEILQAESRTNIPSLVAATIPEATILQQERARLFVFQPDPKDRR